MIEFQQYQDRVEAALHAIRRLGPPPEILVQLGTGLGEVVSTMQVEHALTNADIPGFPQATVQSHAGNLVIGRLAGRRLVVLQGRFHYYEGYSAREVALPIRVLALWGVRTAIITNASGGLNPSFFPGTIMVMDDHLNLLGDNPLRGPNPEEWGERFPDLSQPYSARLIEIARQSAKRLELEEVRFGTYACIPGPSLETPAETRYLRMIGADAVGMSSVPESIVAIHGGLEVLGLSVVANVNNPDALAPILLDDILTAAAQAGPRLVRLIDAVVQEV
jgi:purine-nucleoside phosphorylase